MISEKTAQHLKEASNDLRDFILKNMHGTPSALLFAEFCGLYSYFCECMSAAEDEGLTDEDYRYICGLEEKVPNSQKAQFTQWFFERVEYYNSLNYGANWN